MLRINEIKLSPDYGDADISREISRVLRLPPSELISFEVLKKSLDCREKGCIRYILSVGVRLKDESREQKFVGARASLYNAPPSRLADYARDLPSPEVNKRPIIVGSGPAGLFCALTLCEKGLKPVVLERGRAARERMRIIEAFNRGEDLDCECNVQFGEGGAGTFSDGKLNTGVGGALVNVVLGEFAAYGAPECVRYEAKPHIGTDMLVNVVENMRARIIECGGEVRFGHKLVDIAVKDGELSGVKVAADGGEYDLECDFCVLAAGHSARDLYETLSRKLTTSPKAFAVGARIEHLQSKIDVAQYGKARGVLPPADYKLAAAVNGGRSCYTFCMCPGGYVVCGSSEAGGVTTNGMSFNARGGVNANSALLVNVTPEDYGGGILDGMEFQRKLERAAFAAGGGGYRAPAQRAADFAADKATATFGEVIPTYPRGVTGGKMSDVLPMFVCTAMREGIALFDKKIRGFADGDAVLCGVEARSSSPLRIERDKNFNSSVRGLMPCGEGAGYAGGITSAAIDGIKVAEALLAAAADGGRERAFNRR